jgi:cytochrome c peroxidase
VYSDTLFHNAGVGMGKEKPDLGRGKFLTDAAAKGNQPAPAEALALQGAFKTPSLRGAALSGPYFHDGSVATLEAAVDTMIAGGRSNAHLDAKLKPARLSAKQRAELLAFLESLTPDNKPYARPVLP